MKLYNFFNITHGICFILLLSSSAFALEELRIGLASDSPVKIKAVVETFKLIFPRKKILLQTFPSQSGVANQPVGEKAGNKGASNRLILAQRHAAADESFDYWVSIENFITPPSSKPFTSEPFTSEDESWTDQAAVIIKRGTDTPIRELSRKVSFNPHFAAEAQRRTKRFYPHISTGYAVTVGEIIQETYAKKGVILLSNNWHQHPDFGGVSRTKLLMQTIVRAILKLDIETVMDFPKPGIPFKDITPLLANPESFQASIRFLADLFKTYPIDAVAGLEARGFLLGAPLALQLNKPFIPIRKKGKLPGPVISERYTTEYSTDEIEIRDQSLAGKTVLIVDDLLATGGTLRAAENLIQKAGAEQIYHTCLIELLDLKGRETLRFPFFSLLQY